MGQGARVFSNRFRCCCGGSGNHNRILLRESALERTLLELRVCVLGFLERAVLWRHLDPPAMQQFFNGKYLDARVGSPPSRRVVIPGF